VGISNPVGKSFSRVITASTYDSFTKPSSNILPPTCSTTSSKLLNSCFGNSSDSLTNDSVFIFPPLKCRFRDKSYYTWYISIYFVICQTIYLMFFCLSQIYLTAIQKHCKRYAFLQKLNPQELN